MVSTSRNLENKTLVIFGGTKGIGFQTAKDAILYGAKRVYILGRSSVDLKKTSENIFYISCDVSCPDEILKALEILKNNEDIIDYVIYSAGFIENESRSAPFLEIYEKTFSVNFLGLLVVLEKMTPLLEESKGSFIFISSSQAIKPGFSYKIYGASKAAGEKLVLAFQDKHRKVRYNCIVPSAIKTQIFEGSFNSEEEKEEYCKDLFSEKMGSVEEVSKCILDILTNTYIYGTTVRCDGGRLL